MRNVALACLAGASLCAGSAHAQVSTADAADYENRIEFAFLSEDAKELRALTDSLTRLAGGDDGGPLAHYLAAHADYRLAVVLIDMRKPGAEEAAKACVDELTDLTRKDSRDVEALAQKAACHALLAATSVIKSVTHGPAAADTIGTALALAAKNPRARLVDALVDYWRPAKLGGDRERAFAKFKRAAEAFEAVPPGASGFPSWGGADAYYWLGKSYIDRGDVAAARNALEQALIVAPDYAAARRQLSRLSSQTAPH
jgi:tetratricopeptide (TPR) repeat protein